MVAKLNGLMVVVAEIMLVTLPVAAQETRPTGPDEALVGRLLSLGRDEIARASVAETRGVRAPIRSFAATIARDHRAADQRLVAYAERKNMNLAAVTNPGEALPHGVLALAPLAQSTAAEFDYEFVSRAVADHQAAIDASAAAARLARDPELRAIIEGDMKMMTDHLVAAQELLAALPAPPPRAVQRPGEPAGVSRTNTGADVPPPGALAR